MADTVSEGQASTGQATQNGKDNAAARAILENYRAIGNAYAFIRAVVKTDEVGQYSFSSAVKDRIAQIEGSDDRVGEIEMLQRLEDHIDEYVDRFKGLTEEQLKRATKEGFTESYAADGGVTEPESDLEDPEDVLG